MCTGQILSFVTLGNKSHCALVATAMHLNGRLGRLSSWNPSGRAAPRHALVESLAGPRMDQVDLSGSPFAVHIHPPDCGHPFEASRGVLCYLIHSKQYPPSLACSAGVGRHRVPSHMRAILRFLKHLICMEDAPSRKFSACCQILFGREWD
ncbi:unnamed protein product [Periconia digitata]|uniref:Uncharacterized protein n=1 Tax=Periconia digitata TaxID=1303443 RepID=A0A9W4XS60_9PLEO|nr:unnamed protein product [Periconia digitata]